MCGIVGKISFDPQSRIDPRQIKAMADAIRHRGPDDEGVWTGENAGLGHRRLSIIDLSTSGRNPMCNEDESVWIVFNGEIYNFQELRQVLQRAGHRFRSHTDTEVIVHLYEDLGQACVRELRGMFAFALWDRRKRRLLLARDRLGVKPLHYALTRSSLLFGSEIKAVQASGEIEPEIDWDSLHQYLLWQCIPAPQTAFQAIRKLPPASLLTWRPGGEIRIEKYWELDYSTPLASARKQLEEEVRGRVEEATRVRMIADVPIGLFLSGGIDSACVLAAVRQNHVGTVRTFSASFGDPRFDESRYAQCLSEKFVTEHHEFRVAPNVVDLLPEMATLFDEPFADTAAIPTYLLAKLTRSHVKVALSGDGGDEAFGGYQRYLALQALGSIGRFPGASHLARLARALPYSARERSKVRYARELLSLAGRPASLQYRSMLLGMVEVEQWMNWYRQDFRERIEHPARAEAFLQGWNRPGMPDNITRAMASDTLGYLPECLNVKVDRTSMACGLEVRSPFLDHRLIEFCARIPASEKIRFGQQKSILKRAFKGILPPEILRRGKSGFGLPIGEWLRRDLRDMAHNLLLAKNSAVRTVLQASAIETMLEEHAARKRNWHIPLWRLLVLETWMAVHVDAARKPSVRADRALSRT